MRTILFASLAALTISAWSHQAVAQDAVPPAKACKGDREKFCPGTKPGDGKYGACMKEHVAELSPECKSAVNAARDARLTIRMNCKADTDKFCASAAKEKGGIVKCLETHTAELGQSCADALKARPGAKKS